MQFYFLRELFRRAYIVVSDLNLLIIYKDNWPTSLGTMYGCIPGVSYGISTVLAIASSLAKCKQSFGLAISNRINVGLSGFQLSAMKPKPT